MPRASITSASAPAVCLLPSAACGSAASEVLASALRGSAARTARYLPRAAPASPFVLASSASRINLLTSTVGATDLTTTGADFCAAGVGTAGVLFEALVAEAGCEGGGRDEFADAASEFICAA